MVKHFKLRLHADYSQELIQVADEVSNKKNNLEYYFTKNSNLRKRLKTKFEKQQNNFAEANYSMFL